MRRSPALMPECGLTVARAGISRVAVDMTVAREAVAADTVAATASTATANHGATSAIAIAIAVDRRRHTAIAFRMASAAPTAPTAQSVADATIAMSEARGGTTSAEPQAT